MSSPSVPGRLQSTHSGLRSPQAPQSDDSVWRLPSGIILPPRRFLSRFGVLRPDGSLQFEPRVVRGDKGPLLVLVGPLSCYFQSKGRTPSGEMCGRWLLTLFSSSKCEQWLLDENGDAYDIGALTDAQKVGQLSS